MKRGVQSGTLKVDQLHPQGCGPVWPAPVFCAAIIGVPYTQGLPDSVDSDRTTSHTSANPIGLDSISTTKVMLVPRMGCSNDDAARL